MTISAHGEDCWADLKEFPDYYARLDKLEAEADAYWRPAGKRHLTSACSWRAVQF